MGTVIEKWHHKQLPLNTNFLTFDSKHTETEKKTTTSGLKYALYYVYNVYLLLNAMDPCFLHFLPRTHPRHFQLYSETQAADPSAMDPVGFLVLSVVGSESVPGRSRQDQTKAGQGGAGMLPPRRILLADSHCRSSCTWFVNWAMLLLTPAPLEWGWVKVFWWCFWTSRCLLHPVAPLACPRPVNCSSLGRTG